jgi:raffinose/stachyose/melibiose transport system substrate-binding protein
MKVVRKTLMAGALLAALLPAVGGCGLAAKGGSGGGGGETNLSVWHQLAGSGNTAVQGMVDGFNAENPDLQFQNRELADGEADTVVRTGISSNNPPAILQFEGFRQTEEYAKAGLLTDITPWWEQHKDAYSYADSDLVKQLCSYEGKVYCVPLDVYTSNVLYMNPEIVSKYDLKVPTSVDDFKANAQKLKGSGISTVSMYGGEGWPAAQWWQLLSIQRCGIATINKAVAQDGAKWDDACFLQAAKDFQGLAEAGVFPEGAAGSDYNAMMSLFLSGKSAFMETGTWFQQTMAETPPPFDVQVAPFPQVDPAKPSTEQLGGINEGFGIPAKVGNKDASYKFLDYMATQKSGELFSKASVMNMMKGSDGALPEDLKPAWKQVQSAFEGGGQGFVTYFESLVDPSVGDQAMLNGAAAVAGQKMSAEEFVTSLQKAAAAAKK